PLDDDYYISLRVPLSDYRRLSIFFGRYGQPKTDLFYRIVSELGLKVEEYMLGLAANYGNNMRSLVDAGLMQAEHGSIINCDIFGNCADFGDFYVISERDEDWFKASVGNWVDNLVKVLSIPGKDHEDAINKALRGFAVSFIGNDTDPGISKISAQNIDELKEMIAKYALHLRNGYEFKPVYGNMHILSKAVLERLRLAEKGDAERISALSELIYPQGPAMDRAYFERVIGQDNAVAYVYDGDGTPGGFVIAVIDIQAGHATIQHFGVGQCQNKKDIESALLSTVMEAMEKRSVKTLSADIPSDELASVFTGFGFGCILPDEAGGGFFALDHRKNRTGADHESAAGDKPIPEAKDAPGLSISQEFAKENHLENFVSDGKIGEYISGEGKLSLTVDFWKGHHRSDPHKMYIVARVGGLEIGFAVYDILTDEASLRLHRIVIMDGYKRSGIGQCVMGAIFDHAKSLRMRNVSLMCLKEDVSAVGFYKSVSGNLLAAVHFGDELGAVWWNVSYRILSSTLGFEAAARFADTGISYETVIDQKYASRMKDSCEVSRDYGRKEQSVILYAEDIFASGAMIDLENAVNKIFAEYKLLEGGKIIIFAREELNAIALAHMIKRAGPDIEVITITLEELYRIKPDAAKGEAREAKAILEYARTKGAKDILALVRGPVIAPKEFADIAKSFKVPVIQVGVERAFYSFAQAIAVAIKIKQSEGKDGWLWILPPVQIITKDIEERYQRYRQSLQALAAA
nr:GNAT family N-acetyltransferase [Candidatus Omnitrophota bacterium]